MKSIKKKVSLYWDSQPCNIKNSKKKYMSMEFFNEIEKKKYYVESHIKKFANFKYYKNKTVLEVGCGIGTDAKNFTKYAKQYIGIDYSKKSIEITKKRFEIFKIKKKYNLIHGDAENLSKIKFLKKKRFDLIYSWGVLHHTPNM
jgi:ubiquinone/menaquinone biosynthesis C-methylase UbiE